MAGASKGERGRDETPAWGKLVVPWRCQGREEIAFSKEPRNEQRELATREGDQAALPLPFYARLVGTATTHPLAYSYNIVHSNVNVNTFFIYFFLLFLSPAFCAVVL